MLHEQTAKQLETAAKKSIQTLLLVGTSADRHQDALEYIKNQFPKPFKPGDIQFYQPEKNGYPIEISREIRRQLSLKAHQERQRLLVVTNIELMSKDAQTVLLKVLEEPPARMTVLLHTADETNVLPTILSRAQVVRIVPITLGDAKAQYAHVDQKVLERAYMLSQGHTKLLEDLVSNPDHPMYGYIERAKEYQKASSYDRLVMIEHDTKDRQACAELLAVWKQLVHFALGRQTNAKDQARLLKSLKALDEAEQSLAQNAHPKLLMTNLILTV